MLRKCSRLTLFCIGIGLLGLFSEVISASDVELRVNCFYGQTRTLESVSRCQNNGGAYIAPILESLPILRSFRQSGKLSSPVGQYAIAELYRQTQWEKTTVGKHQMVRWYELAAAQDYFPALLSLGNLYEQGHIVDKDFIVANQYYARAYRLKGDAQEAYFSAVAALGQSAAVSENSIEKLEQATARLKQLKQQLSLQLIVRDDWQQELQSFNEGFSATEFLRDRYEEKSADLNRVVQTNQPSIESLQQQRLKLGILLEELGQDDKTGAFSVAGLDVVTQDIVQNQQQLNSELASIENDKVQQQQLLAKLDAMPVTPSGNSDRMAMSSKTDKRAAFQRYLQEQESSIERRSNAANKRKQKLDFLQKRIARLKQDNKRKISSDDAIVLQRALKEIDHRYQGKVDYLSSAVEKEKTEVANLAQQLEVAGKVSKDKDRYLKVVKQELSKASSLVKKQSKLVTRQSADLAEAIKQMKALHPKTSKSRADKVEPGSEHQAIQPRIVIKWPQFQDSDGVKVADAPAGSIVNVVGAAYSDTQITELSINGQPQELDANGLFMKPVELSNTPVNLDLVMRDDSGQLVQTHMLIRPDSRTKVIEPRADVKDIKDIEFGKYYALIIGNNDYSDVRLESLDTAVNDAQAVAEVLTEKYGFDVQLITNADRDGVLQALEGMRKKLTEKDNLLIYYAGHGFVDPENDQGYWVPVDGSSTSTARWISNATITDQIRAMSARNIMVIADSCYSGSLMRSSVLSLRSGLSPEKKVQRFQSDVAATTRVVLSSGGLQPVADSIDNGKHSVFTGAMLKVLRSNYQLLDADSLATNVSHSVAVATKDSIRQVPRYAPLPRAGHEGGEFYFVPAAWR